MPCGGRRARREAEAKPLWEKAICAYRAVRDALAGRDPRELSEAEQAMLRNCRFALGEVYAALGQDEEAVAAYTEAANAYPDRPEVLEAYVSLAKVYRGMDRAAQARISLEQARLALARIPGNARFDETTNYSRTQWNSVLDWMSKPVSTALDTELLARLVRTRRACLARTPRHRQETNRADRAGQHDRPAGRAGGQAPAVGGAAADRAGAGSVPR